MRELSRQRIAALNKKLAIVKNVKEKCEVWW